MVSPAGTPIASDVEEDPADDIRDNAPTSFSIPETNHILDLLIADPATYVSGNGLKSKAFTTLCTSLKNKFPDRPVRTTKTVGNRIRYVKRIYEEYEFVRGRSGVGWDDEEKRACAEVEFIERFTEEHGDKYAKCFKQTCPYYDRLSRLFGGNKATGAHVLHLKKPKKAKSTASSSKLSGSSSKTSPAPRKRTREPLVDLENNALNVDAPLLPDDDVHDPTAVAKPHDDELLPPPVKRARTSQTPIEIDSDGDDDEKKSRNSRRDRSTSGGSTTGGRRVSRTAETGNQIARGLKSISEGMSAPIITKADTSHVDAVIDVFTTDPTLLPDDPNGEYYALIIDALSANEGRARAFVKTTIRIHRIALLKRVLTEHNVIPPANWV
ncbi:hypothetical protein B0H13DRAFT_2518909 [Mycena leptocephala]|nr:hypothetical protein B0H13DRAFT_2518909 [Mycena leptocephala]